MWSEHNPFYSKGKADSDLFFGIMVIITITLLCIAIHFAFSFHDVEVEEKWQKDAIENGAGEWYLDEAGKRQFRWLTSSEIL